MTSSGLNNATHYLHVCTIAMWMAGMYCSFHPNIWQPDWHQYRVFLLLQSFRWTGSKFCVHNLGHISDGSLDASSKTWSWLRVLFVGFNFSSVFVASLYWINQPLAQGRGNTLVSSTTMLWSGGSSNHSILFGGVILS